MVNATREMKECVTLSGAGTGQRKVPHDPLMKRKPRYKSPTYTYVLFERELLMICLATGPPPPGLICRCQG